MLTEFILQTGNDITGRIGAHPEGADAFFPGLFVGYRKHDGNIGVFAAGDELLDAVEYVGIAVTRGGGAQGRGVAAGMGLGQAERAKHIALRQRPQEFFLLGRRRIHHRDAAHRTIVDRHHGRRTAITGGDFFQHQRQRHVIQAGSAERFRHRDTIGAERSQSL